MTLPERSGGVDTTTITDQDSTAPETDTGEESGVGYPSGRKWLLAGAAMISAGAFLPWFSVRVLGTTVSKRGIEADGVITLVVALLIGGAALAQWSTGTQVFGTLGGLSVTGVGALYLFDPLAGVPNNSTTQITEQAVIPEIGLYLTLFGGAIATFASAYAISNEGPPADTSTANAPAEEVSESGTDTTDAMETAADETTDKVSSPSELQAALDELPAEKQAAIDAVLDELEDGPAVTARDLRIQVYPDHQAGFESADAWWDEFVREFLEAREEIEQLDNSGIRWALADEIDDTRERPDSD
ncbi:hypothetical protein [Halorientalis sp. IM1011]|uniref:hypothetical protein n=1 Tax=Halorientalis sp. IM1011 TaxID=1932360 RepID=UPI0020A5D414|nr:hypothetical protein [Halorientalis sp. IM1011]